MKVTFIQPAVGKKENASYPKAWIMEPIGLGVLAARTPSDISTEFIDDRLELIPYDTHTDLVAINVETYTARRSYAIAARYRKRGIPVILGGYHPTLITNEALNYADSVVTGQAESIWPRILEDFASHRLEKLYNGVAPLEMTGLSPRRDLFRNKKYPKIMLVESGRGCPQCCSFCSVSSFYKMEYRRRPVEEVVKELESVNSRTVFFVDDNITADPEPTKEFLRAIEPLKIKWISQASIKIARDKELCGLMKSSGCLGILIGFESLDSHNLDLMGKAWNKESKDFDEAIKIIHDHGLVIYATFMFGYDHDTKDSISRSLEFAIDKKFFLAAFNHVVPFPGTPLYKQLESQNRLLYKAWWLDPSYRFGDVAFRPANFEPGELSELCMKARKDFYTPLSIYKRFFNFRANTADPVTAALYLFYNMFSGDQAVKRQGLPMGEGLDRGR